MSADLKTFLKLISPFLGGIILLFANTFADDAALHASKFVVPVLGPIIGFEVALPFAAVFRIVVTLLALFCFLQPAFADHSCLFPSHLGMDVFFDDEGIIQALSTFTPSELRDLRLAPDWQPRKAGCLRALNHEIKRLVPGCNFIFTGEKGILHSSGETSFVTRKTKGAWQRYHIETDSKGRLNHQLHLPGFPPEEFTSEFHIIETSASFITISLSDIYLRATVILRPHFRQSLRLSPTEEFYSFSLIAITKLRFFPVISIGNTVYFQIDLPDQGLVPIGYCVYSIP